MRRPTWLSTAMRRLLPTALLPTVLLTVLAGTLVAPTAASAAPYVCSAGYRCNHISGQYQQRSNWCGPAAVATVLTRHAVPGVSQQWLADFMGTDTNPLGFTSPLIMDDAINNRIGQPGYYLAARSMSVSELWTAARRAWALGDVLIVVVYSNRIWHPNAPDGMAHYLVIYGYSDQADGYMVWDPATSRGGAHHLARLDWARVAYPGQFVIAPSYLF